MARKASKGPLDRRVIVWSAIIAVGVVLLLLVISFINKGQKQASQQKPQQPQGGDGSTGTQGTVPSTSVESIYVNNSSSYQGGSYNYGMPATPPSGVLSPSGPVGGGVPGGPPLQTGASTAFSGAPLRAQVRAVHRAPFHPGPHPVGTPAGRPVYVAQPGDRDLDAIAARMGVDKTQLHITTGSPASVGGGPL